MPNDKPAFQKAYRIANEILVSSKNITDFPFSIIDVVKEKSKNIIKCKSFSTALKYGVNIKDFGSQSAVIMTFNGKYIIFYNDIEPICRINFSIAHEFGHFLLGHLLNLSKNNRYDFQEVETNFFAAQLLMPEQIIRTLQNRGISINQDFIKSTFRTSSEATQKSINTLAKTSYEWKSREEKEFDDIILSKYKNFINRISPLRKDYYDYDYEEEMQNKRNSWF